MRTLVCRALPALLVTLEMGAAMAGLVSAVPELVWLSARKAWVFGISGAVIFASAVLHRWARALTCPVDPVRARACARLRRASGIPLGVAAVAWVVGFFSAFLAGPLFYGKAATRRGRCGGIPVCPCTAARVPRHRG